MTDLVSIFAFIFMQGVRAPKCREIFLGFCRQFIPQSQFAQFVTTFWNPLRKSRVKLARSVITPSLFSQNSTFLREKRFILFCHFMTYIYGTWIEYAVKSWVNEFSNLVFIAKSGKPLFEMCCFHIGIGQIALDPPLSNGHCGALFRTCDPYLIFVTGATGIPV